MTNSRNLEVARQWLILFVLGAASCIPALTLKEDAKGSGGNGGAGTTTSSGGGASASTTASGATTTATGAGGGATTTASTGTGMMCDPGKTLCGSACIDTTNDANHCGGCGLACANGGSCVKGACDKKCYALSFNGVEDYATTQTSAGFSYGTTYTIETWYYGDSTKRYSTNSSSDPIEDTVFSHGGCCGGIEGGNWYSLLYLDATTTSPSFTWMIDLGSNKLLASVPTTYDAWHHVAVQQTATSHQIFVDGLSAGSGTAQALPGGGGAMFPLQLGGNQYKPGRFSFGGKIGPTRVSTTLRYNGTFMPQWGWVVDASTTALWNLTEGSGAIAQDGSGSGRTITLKGAGWAETPCPAPSVL